MITGCSKIESRKVLTPNMAALINELKEIVSNPEVASAYDQAVSDVVPIIPDGVGTPNPWIGTNVVHFVQFFETWFTFLPKPNAGLGMIKPFTYFYLNNPKASSFLNEFKSSRQPNEPKQNEVFQWTVKFIKERGRFMDSPESLKHIDDWLIDRTAGTFDFEIPPEGFGSFNEYFTRKLDISVNPRPIAAIGDDSVVVAPADAKVVQIESGLTMNRPLPVKTRQINIEALLNGSSFAANFEGGIAVSCMLLPENYHRFHSPVTGLIIESGEVQGQYNGIIDGTHWFSDDEAEFAKTNFSVFEDFHRSYHIIQTKEHGAVAMIAVGLNTISSIRPSLVHNRSTFEATIDRPIVVRKGVELGHFAYGGSLIILLFEKAIIDGSPMQMGQYLGRMK